MITLIQILTLIENKNYKVIIKEKQDDKTGKVTTLQDKVPIKQLLQNSGEQLLGREVLSIDAAGIKFIGCVFTIVVK